MLADRLQGVDATPVEFYRAPDAVSTRAEDDDGASVSLIVDIAVRAAIGEVEVVRLCGIFGGKRIDLLDDGGDAQLLALGAHGKGFLVPSLHSLICEDEACDLEVGEALTLGAKQELIRELIDSGYFAEALGGADDALELVEEPAVDLRQHMDLLDSISCVQCLTDGEDTRIGRCLESLIQLVSGDLLRVVAYEAVHALADHTQALLHRFLEGAADSHDFPDGLHATAELARYAVELP